MPLMGGVDTADRLCYMKSLARRSIKPYWPLFFWTLDAILPKSGLAFRSVYIAEGLKRNALRDFHVSIARELCGIEGTYTCRSGTNKQRKLDHHYIQLVSSNKRRYCNICSRYGLCYNVVFKCRKCDVWLHIQVDQEQNCRKWLRNESSNLIQIQSNDFCFYSKSH